MNYAIIGYGKMGRIYDKLLSAQYIVDVVPIKNRISFYLIDEFIFYRPSVSLVIVTTPTPYHAGTVRMLLNNGYNVLCEKPLCFSVKEAIELEAIAARNKLILYQSTLERYNSLIKYLRETVPLNSIASIESFRYGDVPNWNYSSDPKYDLAIHDVDLWFYLTNKRINWTVHYGYGKQKRELLIYLKNGEKILLDLLHKKIVKNNVRVNFQDNDSGNQILEMIEDIQKRYLHIKQPWHQEVAIVEKNYQNNTILLKSDLV